jgi:hypothetical protein
MKKSTSKPKGPAPWKSLPMSAYRTQCDQLVTHSIKGVNTNAAGGGVRVIPAMDAGLPYASARFGREPVALDYTKNATQPFAASVATEQLDAVRRDDFHRFSGVIATECADIRENILPLLDHNHVSAGNSVSPRLRQILVDDGRGGDICLTPLHSGGFSSRLHSLMNTALEAFAAGMENGSACPAFFDEVAIKVGGDKAQNAGRIHLISAMQRAYRFAAPAENVPGIRVAISFYHRGVSTVPPLFLLKEYANFLDGLRKRDGNRGLSLQRTERRMAKESAFIAKMVRIVLIRGDRAHNLMSPHVGTDLEGYASPGLPIVQQGLLNPALRDDQWRLAFARDLSQRIAAAKTRDGTLIVGISGRSAEFLQRHIMEALP